MKEYFNVLRLARADFEARGFDASELSDEQMTKIADKIGDVILGGGDFWLAVDYWAEELDLPEIDEKKLDALNEWWHNTSFALMEKITGYRETEFSSEDGSQEFVDACDEWWDKLTYGQKKEIYEKYNGNS